MGMCSNPSAPESVPLEQIDFSSCTGCRFWRVLNGKTVGRRACFFCHDTGFLRVRGDDGECFSKLIDAKGEIKT